ncbi:MAG: hypothetical protein HY226_04395 [Candidatus Vogelbacteria bacterium]|nr:hypothetical protein [Candidatus Vogelbacteria bacterium]
MKTEEQVGSERTKTPAQILEEKILKIQKENKEVNSKIDALNDKYLEEGDDGPYYVMKGIKEQVDNLRMQADDLSDNEAGAEWELARMFPMGTFENQQQQAVLGAEVQRIDNEDLAIVRKIDELKQQQAGLKVKKNKMMDRLGLLTNFKTYK